MARFRLQNIQARDWLDVNIRFGARFLWLNPMYGFSWLGFDNKGFMWGCQLGMSI